MVARRLEDADRSHHVDFRVEVRTRDRHAHVGLGREVEACVGPDGFENGQGVRADIRCVHHGVFRDVLALPRRQVVEDVHLVAAREQRLDQMRADEASTACHDRPHRAVS